MFLSVIHNLCSCQRALPGFAGVGKLTGIEADFFCFFAGSLLDMTLDDCNATPEELPLFSLLSPFQRLSLIADVVVGLVNISSPLPPDTLEHYSALYAIYSFALTQIEVETDFQSVERRRTSRNIPRKEMRQIKPLIPLKEQTSNYMEDKRWEDLLERGKEYSIQEKLNKGKVLKLAKKCDPDKDNVGMSQHESVKQLHHGSEDFMEDLLEIYNEYHGEELTEVHDPDEFSFRRHFHAVLAHKFPTLPFTYTSCNQRHWSFMHQLLISACRLNLTAPEREMIFGEMDFSDLGLLSSPVKLTKYAVIMKRVATLTEEYERNWTPLRTLKDIRMLTVLAYPEFPGICEQDAEEYIKLIPSARVLLQGPDPLDYKIQRMTFIIWKSYWHEVKLDILPCRTRCNKYMNPCRHMMKTIFFGFF